MKNFWQSRRPLVEVFVIIGAIWGWLWWYAGWEKPLDIAFELKQSAVKQYRAADSSGTATAMVDSLQAWAALPPMAFDSMLRANGGDSMLAMAALRDNTDPAAANGGAMPPPPPPLSDSSSLYILLCGDSMSEGLMFAFSKYAKFNGHQLKTRIWYSSSTKDWGKSDTLSSFIRIYRPSLIIFTLGSNELFIKNPQEREPQIQHIIRQADQAGVPFVWIGPPNWKEDTGIGDLIQKNVGTDRYFLSKRLNYKRSKDGAHPTRESSAVWADSIAYWLMADSRYKGKLLLRDPKQYPNQQDRPYMATAVDSSLAEVRKRGSFKIEAKAGGNAKATPAGNKGNTSKQPTPKGDTTKQNNNGGSSSPTTPTPSVPDTSTGGNK